LGKHDAGIARLPLGDEPEAVRIGRRFVREQLLVRGADALVDDAVLVTAELLANARQHGRGAMSVSVSGTASSVRIAVRDGSDRLPVRPNRSTSNMTGRGLLLVDMLSSRWGVSAQVQGKVVWAEFGPAASASAPTADDEQVATGEANGTGVPVEPRYLVVLGDVPTDLLLEAKAHMDNLVRELSLAEANRDVPSSAQFDALVRTVVHTFGDARDAIKRQALAAARRGDQRTNLTLHLPISAAAAGEAYLAALDEADKYSRAARLLTLETPPDHQLFRRWYVGAVVTQLRERAAGREPTPVTPFADMLVAEIRRLASAHRAAERAARLQQVTAALAQTRTPEDVASVVVREGVDVLGAVGGGMLVPAADGMHLAVPGAVGYEGGLLHALSDELLDAPLPAATALRTGEAVWLESREERDRRFPALRGLEAPTVSMCAVPLSVTGKVLGALRFSFDERRLFDADERGFVLALAAQTAQTLLRTELYESERRAALNLQRALLPAELPEIAGWHISTHYSPAGDQQAGGDFYDVTVLPDGRFIAMVGDVMGRGIEAAASMAQVRSTVLAYAMEDPDPASVFRRVDAFFATTNLDQLVTMAFLLADPSTGDVQFASAGHLPPVLVRGDARALAGRVQPAFGIGQPERHSQSIHLAAGETLILITDGLVERRGEDIDLGIARVEAAAGACASADSAEMLGEVLAAAKAPDTDDDVTVLVLRRC
jgi:serine phosphatase RsbU (regulator of sigma subunit)